MKNFIVNIHDFFYGINEKKNYRKTNIVLCIVCNIVFRLSIKALYIYLKISDFFSSSKERLNSEERNILVSLTTFPKRVGTVWMTIESMLNQTIRPNCIIINLAIDEFPNGMDDVPISLKRYVGRGVFINFIEDNLKPHNKYFYSLQDCEYKYLVTIDDDLYYNKNTIKNLLEINAAFPQSVSSNRVRIIRKDGAKYANYADWYQKLSDELVCNMDLLALGYGAVLYPTSLFLDAKRLFNKSDIKNVSPKADDLWLKGIEVLSGIPVSSGNYVPSPVEISGSQTISLKSDNCSSINSGNDSQWKKIVEFFNI